MFMFTLASQEKNCEIELLSRTRFGSAEVFYDRSNESAAGSIDLERATEIEWFFPVPWLGKDFFFPLLPIQERCK